MAHEDRLGPARTNTALREILDRLRAEAPEGQTHLKHANAGVLARHLSNLRLQKAKISPGVGKVQNEPNESVRHLLVGLERIVADGEE
jgi:hypothetical protein